MSDQERDYAGGRDSGSEFQEANIYKELNAEAEAAGEFITKIEKSDIKPHAIAAGETEIVVQRHGKYERDRDDPNAGALTPEAAIEEREAARVFFGTFLNQLSEDQRTSVDVMFVASDTQYFDGGRRSYQTGSLAQQAAEEVFGSVGVPLENIHNTRGELHGDGGPRTMAGIREPQFLDNNPDFVQLLREKYSQDGSLDINFWIAFEGDKEHDARIAMGAEGPDDIADRTHHSLDVLARYSQEYHKRNPDRRLIIWTATHYDTISPFVKRDVFEQEDYLNEQLLVDYGAGISIDIDASGHATTELGGKAYEVPLRASGKRPGQPGR